MFVLGRVTVAFNVNSSIPPQLEDEPEQGQKGQETEVYFRPTYTETFIRLYSVSDFDF